MGKAGRPVGTGKIRKVKGLLLEALADGNFISVACQYAGIDEATFYAWRNRGEKEYKRLEKQPEGTPPKDTEADYHDFYKELKDAEVKAEMEHLKIIRAAALGGVIIREENIRRPAKGPNGPLLDKDGNVIFEEIKKTARTAPDWRASAFFLGQKKPDDWGRNRLELTGKDGEAIQTVGISAADFKKQTAAREKAVKERMAGLVDDSY